MRIEISLPDLLVAELDRAAAEGGLSRADFIASALEERLRALRDDAITSQINAAIGAVGEDLSFVHATQDEVR